MNDPTASDLEKLLERMREERGRGDAASGQVPGPLASNGQSSALRRGRTGSEPGPGGSSRKAVYSAVGNLSFTTAARAVWGLVHDPREKARRLMVPVKMNLAPDATGLAFRIDTQGKLAWETEPVPLSADEALDEKKLGTKLEAASWLFEEVKEGEQRSRDWFRRGTSEMGFSKSTIDRARTLLKLNIRHVGRRGERHTMWSLSDQTPAISEIYREA